MKTYIITILSFVTLTFLTGCYSQLANESDYGNWSREQDDKNDMQYASSEEMDTSAVDDYIAEYDEAYVDSEGNVTNYYFYGYPSYRKYFWDYYPAVSISIGASWYYDPWYWYAWYPSYWYYPTPYCYYPSYWYPNYYYGYYDPYPYYDYGYYPSTYKYRTNDGYAVRNNSGGRNSGGRNSGGERDLFASTDGTSTLRDQLKTREKQIVSGRSDVNIDRTGLKVQERDINRGGVTRSLNEVNQRTSETIRNNDVIKNSRMNEVIKKNDSRSTREKNVNSTTRKKTENTRIKTEKRDNTEKKGSDIKRNSNTNVNKSPKTGTNKTPNREYTPPKSNNNPPRSYSPPRNNTSSPPRGNTSSGSRSSGNGGSRNGGSSNSGRR
jgi:hypothetical protein